jgi:hypothetical protein
MLTGTRDAELGGQSWQSRIEAFTEMPPGCKWLGVIDEATHSHFGGRGLNAAMENLITSTVLPSWMAGSVVFCRHHKRVCNCSSGRKKFAIFTW